MTKIKAGRLRGDEFAWRHHRTWRLSVMLLLLLQS
jgi:hypothetical protein